MLVYASGQCMEQRSCGCSQLWHSAPPGMAVGCCELRLRSTPRYRLVFPTPGRGLPYGSGLGLSRCLGPGECLHSFIQRRSDKKFYDFNKISYFINTLRQNWSANTLYIYPFICMTVSHSPIGCPIGMQHSVQPPHLYVPSMFSAWSCCHIRWHQHRPPSLTPCPRSSYVLHPLLTCLFSMGCYSLLGDSLRVYMTISYLSISD